MIVYDEKLSNTQKNSSIIVNQTYSFRNNTGFYALANPIYYNFYNNVVKRTAWWYDNYVPEFHNAENGYFATGLAHSLVDGISNLIVGAEVKFKNSGLVEDKIKANNAIKSAYDWAENIGWTKKVRQGIKYAGALGTSLLKLNHSTRGLWVEALRMDDFFFESGADGELLAVTCFIKSYTDTRPNVRELRKKVGEDKSGDCIDNKIYLVEHRYFKEEKQVVDGVMKRLRVPYVIYQVHKYSGNITDAESWNISLQETIRFDSLPTDIRKSIGKDFSTVTIGKEQRLPFTDSLGCVLLRYNGDNGSYSQQPFGQSILHYLIGDLMAYDYAFSMAFRDMYQGKGIVFLHKELMTASTGQTAFSGLDDSMIQWVQGLDGDKLPIEQVQFDLRVVEWREKLNNIYETIAMKLNISPSSIASFLSDNTARTAKEVSTETAQTDSYIDIQRGCLSSDINKLLRVVCDFYGWNDLVEIRFAQTGTKDFDSLIDRVLKLKQAGLITDFDALKMLYPEDDDWTIEQHYEKLLIFNKEKEQRQAELTFGMDFSSDSELGGEGM